ncbi:MAG: hypothetical protein IT159_13795 [Bryobacterales bacterium]|nr:hypothetical protein [Bryobacterales bacterium]
MDRRDLLRLALAAALEKIPAAASLAGSASPNKLVLITLAGVRRAETFSARGLENIPRLHGDLLPLALFYENCVNEGVTSHFNTISSILTGVWQHVDDWGRDLPRNPTLINYLRSQLGLAAARTFVVSSNKALTANIGAGGTVILAKQLLIEAVERIILGWSDKPRLDRELLLEELTHVMQQDYERIGWEVPGPSTTMEPKLKQTFLTALANFMRGPENATSGDELTLMVASEVLRRVEPDFLMVNFSDMEIAHSGVYSAYLAGIRRADTLCHRLWSLLQSLPAYAGRTTLIIVPEFGRDPDGSTTNGFFNHRTDSEETRVTWMMVLGQAAAKPAVVSEPVRHVDIAPSLGALAGVKCQQSIGRVLPGFRVRA